MKQESVSNRLPKYIFDAVDDEYIIKGLSSGRVESPEDYNLKIKHYPPYRKGLFDDNIFGSLKTCKCGATTTPGLVCPICGGRVLTKSEAESRMGHYELTYPYISQFKIKAFIDELLEFHPVFAKFATNAKGTRVSGPSALLKAIYNSKITYTPTDGNDYTPEDLIVFDSNGSYKVSVVYYHPSMKDESVVDWGPSGLRNLALNYHLPQQYSRSLNFILKYVNQVFPIVPITSRPAIIRKNAEGKPEVSLHGINTYYRAVISVDMSMYDLMSSATSLADKLMVYYSMNKMIDKMFGAYSIVASSKESLVRNILPGSVKRSGRANIVGETDISVGEVKIPRAMAYECLKSEMVKLLKDQGVKDPVAAYTNPTKETMDLFEDLVSKCCVLMLRNPTLNKTNLSAFKVKLWDEIAIGLSISSVRLFNADFDGDQMAFFFITDPRLVDLAMKKMGPRRNWRTVKDNNFVFAFQLESLQGLYVASQVRKYDRPLKYFTSLEEMDRAYENGEIDIDEVIDMFGKMTTFGREKISDIIGVDLDDLIGKHVSINKDTVDNILAVFETQEDGVERHKELLLFAGRVSTYSGGTTVSLEDIFQTKPITPKIQEVLDSDTPDSVKFRKLQALIPDEMMSQVKNLKSKNILDIIQGAGKIKKDNLSSLFGPRIEYSKETGLVVYDNSISTGFDEGALISHIKENRDILLVKKTLTPSSGYLSRQLINVCLDIVFTEEPSTSKEGVVTKVKDAIGRTKFDGTKVKKSDPPNSIVRVKSCIDNGTYKVSREELSDAQVLAHYEEGDAIGIDVAMAWTEASTQSALALKHGGQLISPSKDVLKSITPGKVVDITPHRIIVNHGGVNYSYARPKLFLLSEYTNGQEFDKGTILGYLDKEVHVEAKLESLNVFVSSFSKTEHVKKSSINITHCYAPCDGIIKYNIDYDSDTKTVSIGNVTMPFYEEEIYIYPEGYKVSKGDRICSGVVSMDVYKDLLDNDMGWLFYIFKSQLEYILGGKTLSEVLEIIFKGIFASGEFSIKKAVKKQGKLLNKLNLGYTRETIREFVGKEIGEGFLSDLLLTDLSDN